MKRVDLRMAGIVVAVGCALAALAANAASPREYHVSARGDDANDGSASSMLRTIGAAALRAQPGDTVTVHEGVYRERVAPPRGGESDAARIVYQAAPGENVVITGSEPVTGWTKIQGDTWKAAVPNALFGTFNPYSDLIHGDWFDPKGREHHTGAVYLDGEWLTEAANLDEALKSVGETPLWYARVEADTTTIWAQFKGIDPNAHEVEINARQTVFYPEKTGIDYITVRGFTLRSAAAPWAPPTAEQIGIIGPHWSKGWVIENNVVSHSPCSGISLGKYGDQWDNTSANSAEGYVKTIERGLENGWNKDTIGHHIVRNNTVAHCEQTGIVGSLGAVFSTIEGNVIHDVHVRQLFSGAEMAGIKLHGAIDVVIQGNHIYRTCRGLWLDWMAQGTRVSGNLFHDNLDQDLFVEVDHGPFVVDNNVFLSERSLLSLSQGGTYAHNLFAGAFHLNKYDARLTPFHKAHSTELAGMHDNPRGDDRYFNNVFVKRPDLSAYDDSAMPLKMDGNVYLHGAKPTEQDTHALVQSAVRPKLALVEKPDGFYLEGDFGNAWAGTTRPLVTTELLGNAAIPGLPYEQRDGSPLRIDTDYFGAKRNEQNPVPGPFELSGAGKISLKVWPVTSSR